MRCVWTSLIALALAAGLTPEARAQIQLASRGPKFLSAKTVAGQRVDASGAAVLRRRVVVTLTGATVEAALKEIARQADLELIFTRTVLPPDRTVTLHATDITVAGALTVALLDTGLDVLLLPGGQMGIVTREEPATTAPVQLGAVVGRVTDAKTGTALVGAEVVVEGTRRSGSTGNDGRYRVPELSPGTYTVRARYIGFAPGSATATVRADQEGTADFALEKSAQRLDEVVTTGSVAETEVKALPNPITIITAEDIRRANVTRVDQLFRGTVPGVVTWDPGYSDWFSSFASVRGSTSLDGSLGTVKTYVDGVELADPASLATIDPTSIERIELIRGPQASTVYGSGALNGVLQVFTKRGTLRSKPRVDALASGGYVQSQFRSGGAVLQDHSLAVSGGGQDFSYNLGGTYQHQGEWVLDYYSKDISVFGSGRGQAGPVTVGFTGKYYTKAVPFARNPLLVPYFPPGTFDKPSNYLLHQEEQTYGVTVDYAATPHWQHHVVLGYDKDTQEYFSTAPPFTTPADSFYQGAILNLIKSSVGYNTTLSLPLGRAVTATTTLGLDYYHYKEDGFTGAQGTTNIGFISLGAAGRAARIPYDNTGYYGQVRVGVADQLFVTGGVRAEGNSNFGANYGLSVSPRVGASYVRNLGSGLTLKARGSYGRAIRTPYPTERFPDFSPTAYQLGNANLGPETQQGPDAGLDLYFGNRASLEATWYHQRALNLIEYVFLAPQTATTPATYQFQNVGEARNTGWEFQGHVDVAAFTLQGTYSITHSTFVTAGPGYTGGLSPGDWLYGVPRTTAGLTLGYHPGRLDASVGLLHVGEWQNYDWAQFYASGFSSLQVITYPGFTKYNLNAAYRFANGLSGFVKVDNLANSHPFEIDNTSPIRGRVTVVGVRVSGP